MLDKENSLYDTDKKLFHGIDKVFHSIKDHYGPLLSSHSFFENQGYRVLSRITLADPYENIGVDFAKAMAKQIHKKYLDGVTTSIILLYALLKESYVFLDQGLSLYKLCCALRKMKEKLLTSLKKHAWPLKDGNKAKGIVFSALPDLTIASEMAEAFASVGSDGFILLSQLEMSHIQITKGLKIPCGYSSPHFISQSTQRTILLSQPRVFVTDKKITTVLCFLPLLQELRENGEHLLIFCNGIDPDVLSTFTVNKLEDLLEIVVVDLSRYPDLDPTLSEDITLFTGTNVFSQDFSPTTRLPERVSLGSCASIEISEEETIIIRGHSVSEVLALKIHQIEEEIRTSSCQERKTLLIKRKHHLQNSVAVVPVSEENKLFYSLALATLTAAVDKGYIPGGGAGLFYASLNLCGKEELSEEEQAAIKILQMCCRAPLEQLIRNMKLESQVVLDKLLSLSTPSLGMNVISQQIEDLIASGILDPLSKIEDIFSLALETGLKILSSKVIITHANK
ncbi:variant chaperonin GroEL3 [Chlamydia psittaci]|uniref:variant chaperonin GroEL3 n=1 Tax=Chlamydia psittaci TaxID=83554 RepID=UPI00027E5FB6|nr:variant chaperonin GroEL3 [Chlamydia psittaci]AFS28428.1 TCP-1/cpn60 chaperonin family protein [Chlamydia psittaci NJ1]KPZ36259.1 TCP-1/cpn60 chaperonin family protein [Chlamydia psittaci NJ1]MDS0919449.1 variant chaperonin GroEL3 [Chlamydia psittaci]MDS0989480.1 variant chaperonin GroEL3 [Chlamydia psittaci]MDS0995455.1 variant chaperonin GroEL3 [Chlamydia psittaci]